MPTCSARGCKNRSRRGNKVTFHLFPKNNEIRQKWIPVTGRKKWTPGRGAVLCSDHFEEACFDRTGQTTRLRVGALPTKGKFAPKIKKIRIKQEPEDDQEGKPAAIKNGITTRSGRQLSGRMLPAVAALKRDQSDDEEMDFIDPDDPPLAPDPLPDLFVDPAPTAHPDHFYCRTQNEMDALLRKSEQKVEFLKMKLDYLSSPSRIVKQEPPDWSQFRRASLQKEAELIKASLQAGPPVISSDNVNCQTLLESDELLREKLKEAEELQRQIKTLQQKNRRLKKRSKAKFIRYVVMIEPAKAGKKKAATCTLLRDGEDEDEDEGPKEEEISPTIEQVSSIQESILSHTASMVVGPNGLLDEKDKQIKDLQKKVRIARQKEKRKTEQLEHLQEVIEILKERCPEFSSEKELAAPRHCSLCRSTLLRRCHRIAESWAPTTDNFSLPFLRPKSHPRTTLKFGMWPWHGDRASLCLDCRALTSKSRLRQTGSVVLNLEPQC